MMLRRGVEMGTVSQGLFACRRGFAQRAGHRIHHAAEVGVIAPGTVGKDMLRHGQIGLLLVADALGAGHVVPDGGELGFGFRRVQTGGGQVRGVIGDECNQAVHCAVEGIGVNVAHVMNFRFWFGRPPDTAVVPAGHPVIPAANARSHDLFCQT